MKWIHLINLRVEVRDRIGVSHIPVKARLVVHQLCWRRRGVKQLCGRKLLIVLFIIVQVEGGRRRILVSSKQASTASMHSHMSVKIARLTESQQTQLALIRFFAAVNEDFGLEKLNRSQRRLTLFTCESLNASLGLTSRRKLFYTHDIGTVSHLLDNSGFQSSDELKVSE